MKKLPINDETWICWGRHPIRGRKQALLVWLRPGAPLCGVVAAAPDIVSYGQALETLVDELALNEFPRVVQTADPTVARLLQHVLGRRGVEIGQAIDAVKSPELEAFREDFIMRLFAADAAPRWSGPPMRNRLHRALAALCGDAAWRSLPNNLGVLVEPPDRAPFGVLIHADCCPGFTVLPVAADGLARERAGTLTLRLAQGERLGVAGRWPTLVEERATPHAGNPFEAPQRRLSEGALQTFLASVDLVLQIGRGGVPASPTLEAVGEVACREADLGVISYTLPLPGGDIHVRMRVA
ncbi:MAG: hypothetical protein FJX76_20560 [Armatimonadetes bacterium]|nr:hypothetical protein [Armatimonadota bacterium]